MPAERLAPPPVLTTDGLTLSGGPHSIGSVAPLATLAPWITGLLFLLGFVVVVAVLIFVNSAILNSALSGASADDPPETNCPTCGAR